MKRLLSLLLVATMLCGLFAGITVAAETNVDPIVVAAHDAVKVDGTGVDYNADGTITLQSNGAEAETNGAVTFTVKAPVAGTYKISLKHYWPYGDGVKYVGVSVNGSESVDYGLAKTASDNTHVDAVLVESVNLVEGENTITIANRSAKWWYITSMTVTLVKAASSEGGNESAVADIVIPSHDAVKVENTGVDYNDNGTISLQSSGDENDVKNGAVTFTVKAPVAGSYKISLKHYWPYGADVKNVGVSVNGGESVNYGLAKTASDNTHVDAVLVESVDLVEGENTITIANRSNKWWYITSMTVTLVKATEAPACQHTNTKLVGKKDATCTVAGYTGDEVCDACGHTVTKGEATATKEHAYTNGSCADCGAADPNYVPPHIIYVKPNANWNIDNARFAAYFFGNGELWVNCTDPDGDGIYEVEVPAKFEGKSVIFCRMNPGTTANNWNNRWNQTSDLTIPAAGSDKNIYEVQEGSWDNGAGKWVSTPSAPAEPTEPTYYVKGSFNDWGDANEMTKGDDGKWTCTIELKAGSHEYKINGSDGYWSPDPNIKLQLSADSIVIFTFDGSKVTTEIQPEATEPEATEPEATEPEATEPEATEPEATEPEATNPTVKIEVPFDVQNAATGGAAERSFTVTTAGTYKVIARVAKAWGSQHLLGVSVDGSEPKDYTIIKDNSMAYYDNELDLVLELEEGEHVITLINNSDKNMHFEMVTLVLVEEAQPDATEPEATNPEATEPEATEPEATNPEATEPEATNPEATEPEATEPEATNPEATEPEATNPEATNPEATEPEATNPTVKIEVPFNVQNAGTGGAAERSFTVTTAGTYKVIARVAKAWGSQHLLGVSVDGSEPKDYTIIKDNSMAYYDNELDLVLVLEEGEHVITLINNSDKNMHFEMVTLVLVEEAQPDATEPEATNPEATEPEATEPEATNPEATEPEATEPEATEPEATNPTVKIEVPFNVQYAGMGGAAERSFTVTTAGTYKVIARVAKAWGSQHLLGVSVDGSEPKDFTIIKDDSMAYHDNELALVLELEEGEHVITLINNSDKNMHFEMVTLVLVEDVEPDATEPEATEPEATEPEATEPEATEPEATNPEATEPAVKVEVPFDVQYAGMGGAAERSFTVTTAGTYKVIARVAKAWGSQHLLGVSVDGSEPKDFTIIKDDSMAYHDNELALVLELEEGEHVITLINNSDKNMHFEMVTLVLVEDVEPDATEPEATEPEATEPEATEPEATEPEATNPEATEPAVKVEVPFDVQYAGMGGAAERSFTITTGGTYKVIVRVAKAWGSKHLLGVSVDGSEPKDYTIIKDDSMAYHDNELDLVLELEEGEHVITLINNSDKNMHFATVTLVLVESSEPDATEPEATEPDATEPEATEPEATEPEATEPEATEPEFTLPEATEPEFTLPEATEPEETKPAPETGDFVSAVMAMMAVSALGLAVVLRKKRF